MLLFLPEAIADDDALTPQDPLRLAHPIEALERRSEQQQRGIVELPTIVDFFHHSRASFDRPRGGFGKLEFFAEFFIRFPSLYAVETGASVSKEKVQTILRGYPPSRTSRTLSMRRARRPL